MRRSVNHWPGATIGRHSLSHARWACQLPQRGSRERRSPPAPSLRELSSVARLREWTPMNVNAQKFQSQNGLVRKSLAWSNHRTTLPQSALRAASSLREGAGNGLCHSTGRSETATLAGDFHRPYEGRLPFNRAIFIAPIRRWGRIWGENWVGG